MTISNIGNIIATETVLNNSSEVRPDWFEGGVRFSRGLIFITAQWRRRDGETIAANEIKTTSTVYANYRHFLEYRWTSLCRIITVRDSPEEAIRACSPAFDTSGDILLRRKICSLNCLRLSNQWSANCHLASELDRQGCHVSHYASILPKSRAG